LSVATMIWLTVTEYLFHKWSWICAVCRNHNSVLSPFLTYHRVCNKSNTTSAACGTGSVSPSGAPPNLSGVHTVAWKKSNLNMMNIYEEKCHQFLDMFTY
jgi:hypothetical protein